MKVAVALGSNLGDRLAHLEFAAARLAATLSDFTISTFHETDPVGAAGPRFLNGAAVGETPRSPRDILGELLDIERARGRERSYPNAPRTLDLDLVLYGDWVVNEAGLDVPHPRFRERRFVLAPLAEIAPEMRDPVTGLTIGELLDNLRSGDRVVG